MSNPFLTKEEEKSVINAIKNAELATSGEIRLHIEKKCTIDPIQRAQQVFAKLKMYKTEQRNGVIIYISTEDHKIVVWGDEGIHKKVGQGFWEEELEKTISHFKNAAVAPGIIELIGDIGEKLKTHFPYQNDDINELPDDISYGDDND